MRKKLATGIFASVMMLTLFSCKKDKDNNNTPYSCTTCLDVPEAIAANDASSRGIYKGVLIGSTGTIKFDIENNGSAITATLMIDGTYITLTSSVEWQNGVAYVAPFTGTFNGSPVTINFSVNSDGTDPVVTSSDIPGHPNAIFTIVKETSNALVEAFNGTYSTTEPASGTLNILLSRTLGLWAGIARETGDTSTTDVTGTIVNGNLIDDSGTNVGSLNGDEINGTFLDDNQVTVTVHAQRVL